MEFLLQSPTVKQEPADAPSDKDAEPAIEKPLWYPLNRIVRLRAFEALSHREYRLLWYGQVFSSMGTWMDQVTRGWLIYELTNSALHLGMVRGIQAIPFLLLSPIAGSTADRYSRKFQVVSAQFANGFLYAVTAVLIFTGSDLAVACLRDGFPDGLRAGVSPTVARRDDLRLGAGEKSHQRHRSQRRRLQYGAQHRTGLVRRAHFCFSAPGFRTPCRRYFFFSPRCGRCKCARRATASSIRRHGGHQESFGQSIIEGWKFSWNKAEVRTGILIVVFASLFMIPFSTLLPVFARDLLGVGAKGQGLLLNGNGRGRAVQFDSDRLARRQPAARDAYARRRHALWPVGRALRFLPWFPLSILLMAVIGLCHVSSHALVQTVIQTYSPPEFRGRTIAIFHMTQVLLLLGGLLIGALSSVIGAPWAAASMSIVGTLCMVVLYIAVPRAREIR